MTGLAAIALCALSMSACSKTGSWLDFGSDRDEAPQDDVILGAPGADAYLKDLYQLASGDPATQAEIFADAQSRAQLTPNPSTTLLYALVLATPGHPEANPQEAQSLLRELLSQQELMTQSEIALATIHVRSTQEMMVLSSEAQRLRSSTDRAQRTEEAAVNQRLTNVEAENRRLRQELLDAESKLEAITSIEQTIREQE